MRALRRPRLTRRQREQLLDGLGDPEGLARLIAAARSFRATGALPGEAAAVATIHSAAVAAPDPQPRNSSVLALSPSRSRAVKAVTITAVSVVLGGVAMAAGGRLPGPDHRTAVASSTTYSAAGPSAIGDARHGTDPSHTSKSRLTGSLTGSPTGSLTGSPTGSPTGTAGRLDDATPTVGLCRAWAEARLNQASPPVKSPRFHDLVIWAGGPTRVAAFCANVTRTWCENHRWPGAEQAKKDGKPLKVDGRPIVIRCIKPTGPPTRPPAHEVGQPPA